MLAGGCWLRLQMIICRRAARKHVQLLHVEVLLLIVVVVVVLLVARLFHLYELVMLLLDADRFGHVLLVLVLLLELELLVVMMVVVVVRLLLVLVVLLLEHHFAIIWNHLGEFSFTV